MIIIDTKDVIRTVAWANSSIFKVPTKVDSVWGYNRAKEDKWLLKYCKMIKRV